MTTTTGFTTAQLIDRYRDYLAKQEYNRPGRSTIARNQFGHYTSMLHTLTAEMDRDLVGLLTEEHCFELRLSEARRLGTPRPDLKSRLRAVRAQVKAQR
jgi:hypothetical protein